MDRALLLFVLCNILLVLSDSLVKLNPESKALPFDGSYFVQLPVFSFGGPFTVEAIVRANFSTEGGPILFLGNGDSTYVEDQIEVGIKNGELYIQLGVTDPVAFRSNLPTDATQLNHIMPHVTTNVDPSSAGAGYSEELVRSVSTPLPSSLSNQYIQVNAKEGSNGIISLFVNGEQVLSTSALDIPVLPTFQSRQHNYLGYNRKNGFVGYISYVKLWGKAVANSDIAEGLSANIIDSALVGFWDFASLDQNGNVINQVGAHLAQISGNTATLQKQLSAIQSQVTVAKLNLQQAQAQAQTIKTSALASGKSSSEADALADAYVLPYETALTDAYATVDKAKQQATAAVPSTGASYISSTEYTTSTSSDNVKSAPYTYNDLSYTSSQITDNGDDDDKYLWLQQKNMNNLKYTNNIANRAIAPVPSLWVPDSSLIPESQRLDGTLVSANTGLRKRGLIEFLITLIVEFIESLILSYTCSWTNDPHYTVRNLAGTVNTLFDYHSPSCHWILNSAPVLVQEQSVWCSPANAQAGKSPACVYKIAALINNRYLVVQDTKAVVTVNGQTVTAPYKIADNVWVVKDTSKRVWVVNFNVFAMSLVGSGAKVKFTGTSYNRASSNSLCVQNGTGFGLPGLLPWSKYDLPDTQCYMSPSWIPPGTYCPDCENNGTVQYRTGVCSCLCPSGWTGETCETFQCDALPCATAPAGNCTGPNTCTCDTTDPVVAYGCPDCSCTCARSLCQNGGNVTVLGRNQCSCSCPDAYYGDNCEFLKCPYGANGLMCSNQGTCNGATGQCQCIPDVSFGPDCGGNCSALPCDIGMGGLACGGHGNCVCGVCRCDSGFTGSSCSIPDCTNITSSINNSTSGCGSHGTCMGDRSAPYCACDPGWTGAACDSFFCTACSAEHGVCTPRDAPNAPYCKCNVGFTGSDCETFTCDFLNYCSSPKGVCQYNTSNAFPNCACLPEWTGDQCQTPLCPNSCSSHGDCIDSTPDSTDPPTCSCIPPWLGTDCSMLPDCNTTNDEWSSQAWEERATAICTNSSFINPNYTGGCLLDARVLDSYEAIYATAYLTWEDCSRDNKCGPMCENFCSFNGLCDATGNCACDPGYHGDDCSVFDGALQFVVRYGSSEDPLVPIRQGSSPKTYLSVTNGATATNNEQSNGVVFFLYHDYRPKVGLCKSYDELYAVVLVGKANTYCDSALSMNFQLTDSNGNQIRPELNYALNAQYSQSTSQINFKLLGAENAAIVFGPISQNTTYTVSYAYDLSSAGTCLNKGAYYASQLFTNQVSIVPIGSVSSVTISSERANQKCAPIASCGQCMDTPGCGWCPDNKYCMEGDASGPLRTSCSVWRFSNNDTVSRVVASRDYNHPVSPGFIDAYLVPQSTLDVKVNVIIPPRHSVEVLFLVDMTSTMVQAVQKFSSQIRSLFTTIQNTYPQSRGALATFTDVPTAPYGNIDAADYTYSTKLLMTSSAQTLSGAVSGLPSSVNSASGGDAANSQLLSLMQVAQNSVATGFARPNRVVVILTGTDYHENPADNPTNGADLYPTISSVRAALLSVNIVPLFVVTDSTLLSRYTQLVDRLGFGYASLGNIFPASTVMDGLDSIFSNVNLLLPSNSFISNVYPATGYTSVAPNTHVFFIVTLDRNAARKRVQVFDSQVELSVPGWGTVTINLANSDTPKGDPISIVMPQNTRATIPLNGDNIYHSQLTYTITDPPVFGTLYQFGTNVPITYGDVVTDVNHRVDYVPAVNGSCQDVASDYCSKKRNLNCNNPCPYATFQYTLTDSCAATSSSVSVSINVTADVSNNRPRSFLTYPPVGNENTPLVITMSGSDRDNDTLTWVISVLPNDGDGTLLDAERNITITTVPYTLVSNLVTYVPPYNRWGSTLGTYSFYVNDGHPANQLGNSVPTDVYIEIRLIYHAPVVYPVVAQGNQYDPSITLRLQVSDPDPSDSLCRSLKLRITTFPNATQGKLFNIDRTNTTQITPAVPYVTSCDGSCLFVPKTGAYGTPLAVLSYYAYDQQKDSKEAKITINVNHVNSLPNATVTNPYRVDEGATFLYTFVGYDVDGDNITWVITQLTNFGTILDAFDNSTVTTVPYVLKGGAVWYIPQKYNTNTDRLYFYPTDQTRGVPTTTYTLIITFAPVNDPPELTLPYASTTATLATSSATQTVTIKNMTAYDPDSGTTAPLVFTIWIAEQSAGKATITFNTLAISGSTMMPGVNTTYMQFRASYGSLNSATAEGLPVIFTITGDGKATTYKTTLGFSVNDQGRTGSGGAKTDFKTIQITTTVNGFGAGASSQVAAQSQATYQTATVAGAVGGTAAAAAGVAGVFFFLKAKAMLPTSFSPFSNAKDNLDNTIQNPMYQANEN